MIVKIIDGLFSAAIDTAGAELKSFYNAESDDEIIWQRDAEIWSGSAPILFPVIGRMRDGKYIRDGKTWEMPKHGLVKKQNWEVVEQGQHRVVMRTAANDFTRQYYQDDFTLDVEFKIAGRALEVNYTITNNGSEPMLFSIGSHPAISLPMEGTKLTDYVIEFNHAESGTIRRLTPTGLLSAKPEKELDGLTEIPLTRELFAKDALFLTGLASNCITVANNKTRRRIAVKTGGAPDLGIWAFPGAEYVCIEPWFGYDDPEDHDGVFEHKPGIVMLEPGKVFTTGYEIMPE